MRRYYTNTRGVPQPKFTYPHVDRGDKRGGVSCLTLSRSGMDLFVSSTDNVIYQYKHIPKLKVCVKDTAKYYAKYYANKCLQKIKTKYILESK